jgi:hypothetical protein
MASPLAFPVPDLIGPDGQVETERLTSALRITRTELALAAGLSRDAVSKTARLHSRATQARLRDVVEIIVRVLPWAGSLPQAYAWYRAQGLPAFGDRTPEDLVKEGLAEALKAHLSRIATGGYA